MMEIIMKQFKKKWLYVVLAGIIVAAGLVWEKSYNIQYAVKSGEIWDTQIITISNYSVFNSNTSESNSSTTNPFMYDKYMKAYPVISAFLSKTGNKFDYKKFDSNWDRYSEIEKIKWFDKHIFVNNFGSGIYEICIHFMPGDKMDASYVKSVADEFINEYINFSEDNLKKYNSEMKFIKNDSVHNYPEEQVISRRDIAIKYGIVGFILGGLVASTIIIITSVVTFYGRH